MSELLQKIPSIVARARNLTPSRAETAAALSGRMDLVGPRLTIAQVLDVINDRGIGEQFKNQLLGIKSSRSGVTHNGNVRFNVKAVGKGNYLAVGSTSDETEHPTFHPIIVMGREESTSPNPQLRLMRQVWERTIGQF